MTDPFQNTYNKPCEHCNAKGFTTVTEQLPPPELIVCRCCGGKGLMCYINWKTGESEDIHHCEQCNGLRYQKNEIAQVHRDLHAKSANSGLHFDLEGFRGVTMTIEEGAVFGLQPVSL